MTDDERMEWALARLDKLALAGRPLDYDDWHKVLRPMLTRQATALDMLGITKQPS